MTRLWWAQIKSVIRLEMKKTLFARRGLWIYVLALLPLLLFTAHTVLTSRDREKTRQIASKSEKTLTYQDLLAIKPEMTRQEVIALLGKPPVRFHWNDRSRLESGASVIVPHEDYHYSDGFNDLFVDLADGKVVGISIHHVFNLPEDSVVFAGVFQFFYLRLAVFFGCLGIFMNLFRGEILDKSLHFYFLAPIRRDVLMVGKFLAGLLATCIIFVTSEALRSSSSPGSSVLRRAISTSIKTMAWHTLPHIWASLHWLASVTVHSFWRLECCSGIRSCPPRRSWSGRD